MKWINNKVIFFGFGLNIFVVLILAWSAFKRMQNQDALCALKLENSEISIKLQTARLLLTGLENSAKSYAITKDEKYITQAHKNEFEIGKNLEQLNALVLGSPAQAEKLKALEDGISRESNDFFELIEKVKYKDLQIAKESFAAAEKIGLAQKIDRLIASLDSFREAAFKEESEQKESKEKALKFVFVASFAISLVLLVVVLFILLTYLKHEKKDEVLLAEGSQLLRSLIDNSSNLIYVKEINGRYLLTNRHFDNVFRKDAEPLTGRTDHQLFSREVADKRIALDLEVVKAEKELRSEETLPHNGDQGTYVTTRFPIRDQEGKIYAVGGISVDISERAVQSAFEKEQEEQIKKIFTVAPDAIIVIDQESTIVRWNPRAEQLFKWKAEEVIGKHIYDTIMPEQFRNAYIQGMKPFLESGEGSILNKSIELRAVSKDRVEFDIELTVSPIHKDKFIFVVFIRDISGKKVLERERDEAYRTLGENEKRISLILENTGDAVIATDQNLLITYMNPVAEKLTGWKEEEGKGKHIDKVFVITNLLNQAQVENPIFKAIAQKRAVNPEKGAILIRKDKTAINISDTGSPILDEKGEVTGAVLLFRDVTEEKKAEREIANAARRFSQMLNFAPVAISISDMEEGRFIYVNDTLCKASGYTREELVGHRSVDLKILTPEQREALKKRIVEGGGHVKDIETVLHRKNGEPVSVLYSVETIEIDGQLCLATAMVDITERKNAEIRIEMILENIDEGVMLATPDQQVILSNHLADEILGIRDSHYSTDWADRYDVFYPDGRTLFPAQNLPIEKAFRGEAVHDLEIVLQDPETKERKLLRVSGQPIISQDNRLMAAVITLKDITKLRDTERELEETETKYRKLIGFRRDQDSDKSNKDSDKESGKNSDKEPDEDSDSHK